MAQIKIPIDFKADKKPHIIDLYKGLAELNIKTPIDVTKNKEGKILDAIKEIQKEKNLSKDEIAKGVPKETIKEFQKANNLKVDGELDEITLNKMIDAKTTDAIKEFQKASKLVEDGVLGEITLNEIIKEKTTAVIKEFQKNNKLKEDGKLGPITINALNTELHDKFITSNKTRTEKLHTLLSKLNIDVDVKEKSIRKTGDSTRDAIKKFQEKEGLLSDGKLSEDVLIKMHESIVKNRFYSPAKNQRGILHATIQKVNKISKLNLEIDPNEIKRKELGDTSIKFIEAFQEKYKLPVTGEINKATFDKLTSVAASKGTFVKKISAPPIANLKTVTKELRLNTVSPLVSQLQKNLSFLGYKISEKEFKTQTFGKTTIKSVNDLQKKNGLVISGHYDKATMKFVNRMITSANPEAIGEHRYRIRGSVRDELWQRKNNMVIKIYELILEKESAEPLAAKKIFLNGFFDIAYDAPINPINGQIKEKFHIVVKLYTVEDQNNPIAIQTHYNVNQIHWVNFTESKNADGTTNYDGNFLGDSEFALTASVLQKAIGEKQFAELKETADDKQISQLSIQTGLSTDEIMRHVLAQLVAKSVNKVNPLSAEVFYSFIAQNLPPGLPGDLLRGTSDWETIEQLTEIAASGIIFLDSTLQQQALTNAVSENLVTQAIKLNNDLIIVALNEVRTAYALTKPILIGNGNLQSLLDISKIDNAQYNAVANIFVEARGINTDFWTKIKTIEEQVGADAITDFATTVEIANFSKNHIPTVQFIKNNTGAGKRFKIASDAAKLDQAGIVDLINDNGKLVPDNMPGATVDEKVANYARDIKSRSEFLFPAVSLVATTRRVNVEAIKNIDAVEKFIDDQKELNFREQNLDKYIKDNNIPIDKDTKTSLKIVQRINKLTLNANAGAVLINKKMHSSMQIYFAGKETVKSILSVSGVEDRHINLLYESAKTQYMGVLARITDFRREVNYGTPAAIIPQIYTTAEIKEYLGDLPDLEKLFGTLDYCECDHCKSLYGPAAYLTDMLRFLRKHDSLIIQAGITLSVKDILFLRRPDIGNIKLNCDNTNTALPYIDLVCEILENYLIGLKDFKYQTTLSQKELRAIPENVQPEAYKIIAAADFPMYNSFNLWQEEARTYLNYLRVPRYELMEAFQNKTNAAAKVPDDISIAAEYFNLSWKEKDLIVNVRNTAVDQNKYWGFDTNQVKVSVAEFKNRTRLTYYEILELLMVKFVNPDINKSTIEKTIDSCDVDIQSINNLTLSKFDLMHRFIRLWRKTGWKMWELDLLLRNSKIGNNKIDGDTIVNLKLFKQLQTKLKISVEALLAFYGDINREIRIKPEKQDVVIQPLYNYLFQNISVTNPVDSKFKAIDNLDEKLQPVDVSLPFTLLNLDSTIRFEVNAGGYNPVPTILSALALSQTDFDLLVAKTNNTLSVTNLSTLYRYTYFARLIKLSVADMFLLLDVTNTADPFTDLLTTTNCLESLKQIKLSGLTVSVLDYVLNYKPDSSIGLRDESTAQLIEGLRRILEDSKSKLTILNAVIAFDTAALALIANPDDFLNTFSSIQGLLISSKIDFIGDAVSADEIKLINEFSKSSLILTDGSANPAAVANKNALIAAIGKVQAAAALLLGDTVIQKQNQITSLVASSFSISAEQSGILLAKLTLPPSTDSLMKKLENESLIAKDAAGEYSEINRDNFAEHFTIYTLLYKSALLVAKMKIETENLDYFIINDAVFNTIDFSALPLTVAVTPNQYSKWYSLYQFLVFKTKFPEPEEVSIRSILDLAKDTTKTNLEIKQAISLLTTWDEGDDAVTNLSAIESGLGVRHTAANLDYTYADLYIRLIKCFDQLKLTGTDAITVKGWLSITGNLDADIIVAQQTRQAVKSKYEQDDWLSKVTPLHDDVREKKSKALVDYFIDNSLRNKPSTVNVNGEDIPNPEYWKDAIALYKFFLIEVEMSSCQLTSRIKQALSSVQLFVQRCFLNFENRYVVVTQDEKANTSSPDAWSQWKWMKNYRIWEANRKIFFYPENWLEPELRDDKSPFFKELENELMQNEVTKENVETAFLSYLHKMDEVSHLEVCGLYHQMEDYMGDDGTYAVNIVHVIGRTKAIPNIYYYRSYDMNYNTWSAWDKIDVDITGDHVTPVIYNRKLHLFWLQFMEKPMKTKKMPATKPTDGPTDSPEPLKVLEVQLGWTIKKTGGWSSKKISKQKLIHPWERPYHSYNLKPYYSSQLNELYLDIYITTSKEFNNESFFDVYQGKKVRMTKVYFDETYLPWHSSSFIFDGDVRDVEIKGLIGKYYLPEDTTAPSDTNSFVYVHSAFGEPGTLIGSMVLNQSGPRLRLPVGMHFKNTHLTNNRVNSPNNSSLRVLEESSTVDLLTAAQSPFELVITQQDLQLNTMTTDHPMFYQDSRRSFFIKPDWEARLNNYGQVIGQNRRYRFFPFYHPYTMLFIREFNRDGIDGLINRKIQLEPEKFVPENKFKFSSYSPTDSAIVVPEAEKDIVDFSFGGASSIYNWELFFHAPLMVACRLMQNQKFEDAMTWFHYIFDPTNIEEDKVPQRYWITKPFYNYNSIDYRKQRIESILSNLDLQENMDQLTAWRNNPFKPHLIARYRPVAYQKNVVMKYLDNLIAWGDMLFKRDTIESINEASLLYMLAYEILGERPQKVPTVKHEEFTFNELESKLDEFGNALVSALVEDTLLPITVIPSNTGTEPMPKLDMFYFCIPNNDYLTKYWDTVEDRLYKIRHCMNIAGIVRQLPLFEPPIDPALLVKAAAAGIDLSSVLNDLAAPTPFYRFRIVSQKAIEFCNEVKGLGEKLLSALEKKDVETLSLLRSQHEIQLLEAVKQVRKKQIDEAVETIGSLNKSKESAEQRKSYYEGLPRQNDWETGGVVSHSIGIGAELAATIVNIFGASISMVPDLDGGAAGVGGSPTVKVKFGGTNFGNAASKVAEFLRGMSAVSHATGSLLETQGSYSRRDDENKQQAMLATIDIDQIQFQINAAEIRQLIAELELENQEMQIENSKAVDDYMRNKYTNDQLFSWMITQISTVYFQAYQLAFDMAKKAEKCFMYELGITESNIVQFGYWDSLKKGLLSGDKLMNDLRRLESEYINQNKREFEITKHISLAQMFPLSLITLKETGQCTVSLPEFLFDMDYPGHYMRRIKNVSISIPCIVGPYTSVNCTLSILSNETRMDATLLDGEYPKKPPGEDDERFKTMFGAISSIATSSGQNDSGMFELNFNDERYLPFEGAGVISTWQISLPKENNYFDFASLSDIILHISYTSRNGGGQFAVGASANVQDNLPLGTARLFSLRHEFATEWYKFLNPVGGADQELVIELKAEHFPFFIRNKLSALQIKNMDIFVESKSDPAVNYTAKIKVTTAAAADTIAIDSDLNYNSVPHATKSLTVATTGTVSLMIQENGSGDFKSLTNEDLENIFILFQLGS